MFSKAKNLTKIVKHSNKVYFVQKIRELKIEESYNTKLIPKELCAVLKLVRNNKEYYFGVVINSDLIIYDDEKNYETCHIVNFNPDVHVFKEIQNPIGHSDFTMEYFIKNSVNLTCAPFSIIYQKEQEETERKKKELAEIEEMEEQNRKDKIAARAKRKADFFDSMRETIADESRKVLEKISDEQHGEVIQTITSIANEVANKIVLENYTLVEDYYNQAYLQTVQLEEKIRAELLTDYAKVITAIHTDFEAQLDVLNLKHNAMVKKLETKFAALKKEKKPLKVAIKKPLKSAKKKK